MEYGICLISMIPVRRDPAHKSEMVTQLLFGETYEIISKKSDWYEIKTLIDKYIGWINHIQYSKTHVDELQASFENSAVTTGLNSFLTDSYGKKKIRLYPGSIIPQSENNNFEINEIHYSFQGESLPLEKSDNSRELILKNSIHFDQSPYLWGGKTPYGTDCSGMVQILYRTGGILIPRDACDQATVGETINFLSDASPGDLLFFDDDEGIINHTGLLIDNAKIIHASGLVKTDEVDHQGIFDKSTGKYTHRLRIIKKII